MANNEQGKPASDKPEQTTADGTTPIEGEAPASDTTITTPPENALPPKVADVDEYEKMVSAVLTATPQERAPEGQPPAPGEPPAQTPPDETPPVQPKETTPPTPPQGPDPAGVKIPDRIRLGGLSEKSQAKITAATLLAKAEGIEFDEAYARMNASAPSAAAPPPQQGGSDAPSARTIAEIDADLVAQKQALREARREMNVDAEFAAEDRMEELRAERDTVMQTENARIAAENEQFEQAVDASQADAEAHYPVMKDPAHAIHAEAKRIWSTMEKMNNPLLSQPEAVGTIYAMAANTLGIAPTEPGQAPPVSHTSPPATPKPQIVNQVAVRRSTPAGAPAPGSARTTPVEPTNAPGIGQVRTVADYERLTAGLI